MDVVALTTTEPVQGQHGPGVPVALSVVGSLVAYALSKSAGESPTSRATAEAQCTP